MTEKITAAGYIVTDGTGLIVGLGATQRAAYADCMSTFRRAGIVVVPKGGGRPLHGARWIRAADLASWPASAALLQLVEAQGGDCPWRKVNGIACTHEEAGGNRPTCAVSAPAAPCR